MKKLLLSCWSIGMCLLTWAQEYPILEEITHRYNQAPHLSMHLQVKAYDNNQLVLYTEKIEAHKQNELYYTRSGNIEMMTNLLNLIVVNHAIQQIMVAPYDKQGMHAEKMMHMAQVDSLLKRAEKISEQALDAQRVRYTIYSNTTVHERIEIDINTHKKTFEKINYLYANEGFMGLKRMEIVFEQTSFKRGSRPEVFNDQRFLVVNSQNELIQAPDYATYEVVET